MWSHENQVRSHSWEHLGEVPKWTSKINKRRKGNSDSSASALSRNFANQGASFSPFLPIRHSTCYLCGGKDIWVTHGRTQVLLLAWYLGITAGKTLGTCGKGLNPGWLPARVTPTFLRYPLSVLYLLPEGFVLCLCFCFCFAFKTLLQVGEIVVSMTISHCSIPSLL